MTVSTTSNRIVYTGNGSTTVFAFPYKFTATADIKVYVAGVLQTSGYTVGTPSDTGANVTFSSAPASSASIVILADPARTQATSLPSTGPFPAKSVEAMSDKLTLLVQRLYDLSTRSMTLADGDSSTASTLLPTPAANQVIGWNPTATALQNLDPSTLATIVAYGTANRDFFTGDGSTKTFTLSANPGAQANLDVDVGGVTQAGGIDFTWSGGTTFTFTSAPPLGVRIQARYFQGLPQGTTDSAASTYLPSRLGAVATAVQTVLRGLSPFVSVDATGATDITSYMQAELNDHGYVFIPEGVYKFSAVTVNKRGALIKGSGQRTVLIQTGAGAAFTCLDTSATIYPGGANAYVNDGQFTFSDFTLYTNGTIGFDFGKNRTTGSSIERVYMKPYAYYSAYTNSTYVAGTTAISCDNTPFGTTSSTYGITVRQCWIAGYENIAKLDQTVNFWNFDRIYGIDNLRFLNLAATTGTNPGTTGIHITNSYFESGVAAARGIVFGVGGGNNIGISNTTFELTNVAATQYAYDFSAGGTWSQITATNCKYLIQGDGNGVNNKRITGTAPATFVELGRTYTNATLAADLPMLWAPGTSASVPFQQPNFSRFGGIGWGNGTLLLGRGGSDASDLSIANDGAYGITITTPDNGSLCDFKLKNKSGATYLNFTSYTTPGFIPGQDNAYALGSASFRWSTVYSLNAKMTPVTVANLPAAGTIGSGAKAFVSDATATTFASIVAGGGANVVPVYSDGTNWRIG